MRKPDWLKVPISCGGEFSHVSDTIHSFGLNTVCDSARCPNKAECWSSGTATFMILGEVCTRACKFCAVKTASKGEPLAHDEPARLAEAAMKLGLKYVVITSVDRDDLTDGGASHYARCIQALKAEGVQVEALIPDYVGCDLEMVTDSSPDVLSHNIEVVRELQHLRDHRASYDRSLMTLKEASGHGMITKSSIMLGLGETQGQILAAMDDLLDVSCESLVIGQYLQPTKANVCVSEYIHPEEFDSLSKLAKAKGFRRVVSEPLARTSYHAGGYTTS